MFLFVSLIGNVIAGEPYRYQGTKGILYNFTNVPNKDLRLKLFINWPNIFGGVESWKDATVDIEKDGSFELEAQKFSCWLCSAYPKGTLFIDSKKDKNKTYVLDENAVFQKELAVSIYTSLPLTSTVVTSTVQTLVEWKHTHQAVYSRLETNLEMIDPATKKIIQSDQGYEDATFSGYDRHFMGKLVKGQKILLHLKAKIIEDRKVMVVFDQTVESTFPVKSYPESFNKIVLDVSQIQHDISGTYRAGNISQIAILGSEFKCENNQLSGVLYLDEQTKTEVSGDCADGSANFKIDVILHQNGWEKRVQGIAQLKVFGDTSGGYIVDDNGDQIAHLYIGTKN